MDGVLRLTLACLVVALAGTVRAGEYTERVEAAKSLQPLGEAPFGERIDLHTGEVTFHQTDILLEGTGPAIRIARLRPGNPDPTQAAAFGDWVLDVPRVDTLVADDGGSVGMQWRLNAAQDAESFARCTRFAAPHAGEAGIARAAWWEGVSLHLGDGQAHTVLRRAPEWTPRPEVPGEFPAVTTSHVQIGCLAATRNGEAGEAFLALSPDGLRHRLDWLVGRAAEAVADGTRVQRRTLASMVATRVEDRFGNSVDYVYEDARLRAILASDGRHVEIAWSGDHISHITTHPESDAPRTWQYAYVGAKLAAVVQPDGSRWAFDLQPTGAPIASVLTTPSGLTGTFVFEPLASRLVLVERRWSGPGVDARWSVRYGQAQCSAPRDAHSGDGTCGDTHWRDVIEPDGARHRHTFSTACGPLEGKRLRTETFDPDGTLLRTEALAYATLTRVGDALRGDAFNASPVDTLVPLRERTITQQRSDFRWRVLEHDAFGRAIAVERSGTRTRIDRTTHADSMSAWVLGQVATESFVDPDTGIETEMLRIERDPRTALPVRRIVRGLLQETLTYHADGTLASRSDGRDTPGFDTTIRYSGWTRGIPTRITFPGGIRTSAGVEVDGTVRWIVDASGARTCFAYDAMGRVVRITWPDEAQPSQCSTAHWNETTTAFVQATTATALLAAGHWRQAVRSGNGLRHAWYDALWRPVLEEEHDTAEIAGTRRTLRTAYDAAGRTTFRSYPSALAVPPQEGETTHHDALGRIVRIERSSELGPLVSAVEYLDGFRVRETDARGEATTVRLGAWDTPELSWPDAIVHPGGLHVDIERDPFGHPERITRRDSEGATAATHHAVHDAHGRLCKTIEPDRGATVIGRDIIGNVTWTVMGAPFDDATACQHAEAHASGQRVDRTYDAHNRLATVSYPDGVGNQARLYTPDGRLRRITTYNARAGDMAYNAYLWNARRLLVDESITHSGETWHLQTAFDRNGHATTLTYPNRTAVGLVPNALGQPTRVGSYATGVRWHPDGSLARFTYGSGIVHETTRNRRGLPERRRDAVGGTVLFDESLDYDAHGHVVAISDGLPGASGDRDLRHDAAGRLVEAASPLFGTASYAYDVLGRPTRVAIGGPDARTHQFCRDQRGHLTNVKSVDCAHGPSVIGLAYDAAGYPVRMNAQTFRYDAGHRLREVAGLEAYAYDGHDRRLRATSLQGLGTVRSQYDHAGRLMWQSDGRDGLGKLHLYLGSRLIAIREQPLIGGTAAIRYLHVDAQGTPVVETDHTRATVRRNAYEPFGKWIESTPGSQAPDGVGFGGDVMDRVTGLRYTPRGHVHPVVPVRFGACGWMCGGQKIPTSNSVLARSQWLAPCATLVSLFHGQDAMPCGPATSDWE